jgi:hypothetical protein
MRLVVSLACVLSIPLAAQSHRLRDPFDPDTGARLAQEQQDYSAPGMLSQYHGQFLREQDRWRPALSFSLLYQDNAEVSGEPGDFEHLRWNVQGSWRRAVDPDQFVILEPRVQGRKYEFKGTDLVDGDDTVYDLELGIGFGSFMREDLLLEAVVAPGVHSDLEGTLHHQDWKVFGRVLATWRGQEHLYWKIGVEVSELFDGTPIYPLLGFGWQVNDQWRLDLLAPRRLELTWLATDATHVYGALRTEGDEYRVRDGVGAAERQFDVRMSELDAAAGILHRLNDQLSLFGEVGTTVAGNFEWSEQAGNDVDGSRDAAWFLRVGFGIDF